MVNPPINVSSIWEGIGRISQPICRSDSVTIYFGPLPLHRLGVSAHRRGLFSLVLLVFQAVTNKRVSTTGAAHTEVSVSVGQAITDTLTSDKEISVHSRMSFFRERLSAPRSQVAHGDALQAYVQQIPRLIVELALIVGAIEFVAFEFATSLGNPELSAITIFIIGSLRMMSSLLPLYRSYICSLDSLGLKRCQVSLKLGKLEWRKRGGSTRNDL